MDTLLLSAIVISWILCYGIAVISHLVGTEKPDDKVEYKDVLTNAFWMFGLSWIFGIIVIKILQALTYIILL